MNVHLVKKSHHNEFPFFLKHFCKIGENNCLYDEKKPHIHDMSTFYEDFTKRTYSLCGCELFLINE